MKLRDRPPKTCRETSRKGNVWRGGIRICSGTATKSCLHKENHGNGFVEVMKE